MQNQMMWFPKADTKEKAWHKQEHLAGFLAPTSNTGLYFLSYTL